VNRQSSVRRSHTDPSMDDLTDFLDRFLSTHSESDIFELAKSLASSANPMVAKCPRNYFDQTVNQLGPYNHYGIWDQFDFVSEKSGDRPGERPILSGSKNFIEVSGLRIPKESLQLISNREIYPDCDWSTDSMVHTYLMTNNQVLKWELRNHEYYESSQVLNEICFLLNASDTERRELGLPHIITHQVGQFSVSCIRSAVQGIPADSVSLVAELCARYANLGLFHNDVRPWNLLEGINEHGAKKVAFIDFGHVSRADHDSQNFPQILALLGTLLSLGNFDLGGFQIRAGDNFKSDLMRFATEYLQLADPFADHLYDEPWRDFGQRYATLQKPIFRIAADVIEAVSPQWMNVLGDNDYR